jgi:hypothetical protein
MLLSIFFLPKNNFILATDFKEGRIKKMDVRVGEWSVVTLKSGSIQSSGAN